jgi:hypothetical protein
MPVVRTPLELDEWSGHLQKLLLPRTADVSHDAKQRMVRLAHVGVQEAEHHLQHMICFRREWL